jgi:hypothetical protein
MKGGPVLYEKVCLIKSDRPQGATPPTVQVSVAHVGVRDKKLRRDKHEDSAQRVRQNGQEVLDKRVLETAGRRHLFVQVVGSH